MSETISLVIPTYNERANISPLLEALHGALSDYRYEVVFIDDDSKDGTAELASALSDKYPVSVIVRSNKRGLASAVVDGLKHTSGEIIVVMDADLQHPPEVIPILLEKIKDGAEIAIASRYVKGGSCQGWGLLRRIMSKGAILLAHFLLPLTRRIADPMSGFFVFRKEVTANSWLKPTGYKILLEILTEGEYERVVEVPYSFRIRNSGKSKLNLGQQVEYLKHLYSLAARKGELQRFAKFCLVGLSGVLVNMGLLWLLTEFAGLFYLASAAISIETSIISNFMLNDFFTFPDRRLPGIRASFMRLAKFNTVSLAGLVINMGILWLFTDVIGLYYLISNLLGIIAATLWNYTVNLSWTWKPSSQS